METSFRLNAADLDIRFLEALRQLFTDQNIVINVATEADTTDYLLSDPARKARLMQALKDAETGNLVSVNLADYAAQ